MEYDNGFVKEALDNGILSITFFHPQSNSLPGNLLRELTTCIKNASQKEEVTVIVLQSAGTGAFCAGASFDELTTITTEAEGLAFFSGFANLVNAMRTCSKIIIGRIHGKCAGGGAGLAAACDYAIATKAASIKLSELAIGIGPFVIGPVVERKIGTSAFSQLAIDATNWRDSNWCLQKGLYAAVYDDITAMDMAIGTLSNTLRNSSPEAMTTLKQITWQGTDHWDFLLMERAAISGSLVLSKYTKAAIASFKAK